MHEINELLRLIAEILIAAAALIAALESRRVNRRTKRMERELNANPEKSADAVVRKVNGSGILMRGTNSGGPLGGPDAPPPPTQPGPPS